MVMTPPQAQLQVEVLVRAGKMPIFDLMAPGCQGPIWLGMQGMGVSTPRAAVVAAATAGFAGEVHMPKGGMLAIGAKSIVVAARATPTSLGGGWGVTIKLLGAVPKGMHWRVAPIVTCSGIVDL
jgi:hypothetical protein